MLRWALGLFIIAIVAGLFGFVAIFMAAVGIAKLLLYLSLALVIVSLVMGFSSRT
jgi:uncharacterized membrane protein YtjA (UPF0391 family)